MGRTALLIANPAAGLAPGGAGSGAAERAAARLTSLGVRAELYRTTGPRDGERAARQATGSFDLVIAAGGDGTVHEVANGLALSGTAMGVVPLGSMNILARELAMPLDPVGAAEWIARAEPQPIALGRRAGRWFVLMAGIGYDAFVLARALARARSAARKVDFRDYTLASFGAALGGYSFPAFGVEGGGRRERGVFALAANCARYGGNLRIARHARLEEPLLDVVIFPSGRFRSLVLDMIAVLAGRTERARGVVYFKSSELEVRGEDQESVPCQMDGEPAEPLPARFQAVAEALILLRSPARP